jgi:hypothetical protein
MFKFPGNLQNSMTMILFQLRGMMYYEFLRHWRRRGLPMTMVLWLFAILLSVRLFNNSSLTAVGTITHQEALLAYLSRTIAILTTIGGISTIFCVLTMGVMAAEIIPIDKQLGVMEWQEALPLETAVYLTGKLLGLWVVVLMGLVGVTAVSTPIVWWLVGDYDISIYLRLWLLILTPITLVVSGITSLLGAGFSSRRWAMFLGITLAIICYAYVLPSFIDLLNSLYTDLILSDCASHPELCELFRQNESAPLPTFGFPFWQIAITGLAALAGSWLAAWGIQRWQERRR